MADERMSRQQPPPELVATDQARRPLPKWMFRVLNPALRVVLRSPLHRLISHHLLLLSFSGRTSGRPYVVPVAYLQQDRRLYFTCLAGWWQNLPGALVTVDLRGQQRSGTARRIVEPDAILTVARLLIVRRGAAMARRIGLTAAHATAQAGIVPWRPVFMQIDLEE